MQTVYLPFFIFAAVCFFLSFYGLHSLLCLRQKQITPLFLLYKKLGYVDLNSL